MKWDVSKVYTAVNADQLKIGSKVLLSNCIVSLKDQVANYKDGDAQEDLINICSEASVDGRFETRYNLYHFAYLIAEPEEKHLKWTDLKIGDIIENNECSSMVTAIDRTGQCDSHILAGYVWIFDKDLKDWEKVKC